MEDEAKLMRDKLTERFDRMMKVLMRKLELNSEPRSSRKIGRAHV